MTTLSDDELFEKLQRYIDEPTLSDWLRLEELTRLLALARRGAAVVKYGTPLAGAPVGENVYFPLTSLGQPEDKT